MVNCERKLRQKGRLSQIRSYCHCFWSLQRLIGLGVAMLSSVLLALYGCMHTWFVPKVSVLIFYLIVCWTHMKLQVISFKVRPLGSYTVVPTFPEMMSLQLRFQLGEEVEIAPS